jgi:hypothetical protein
MDVPAGLGSILQTIPFGAVPSLLNLYDQLRRFFRSRFNPGLYEMLEYEATLELLDPEGQEAVFKKRQRVKFLQDNVIAFEDYAWGDGNQLAQYCCSPGIEVDHYREGDRWNILISLRETKNRGDSEEFYLQRKVLRGFTKAEEWWQIEMQHETRHLKMSVLFPVGRHSLSAVLVERKRNCSTTLGPQHFVDLPEGRQLLTWETRRPQRFETYTLQWRW